MAKPVRRTGAAVEDLALRGGRCDMCGEDLNVRQTVRLEPDAETA